MLAPLRLPSSLNKSQYPHLAPLLIPLPNFQQSVQSERTALSQIERLASAISLPQPNTLAETVRLLQSHMAHRERELLDRIRSMLGRCMKAFLDRLAQMETEMAGAMERRDIAWVTRHREEVLPELIEVIRNMLFHNIVLLAGMATIQLHNAPKSGTT